MAASVVVAAAVVAAAVYAGVRSGSFSSVAGPNTTAFGVAPGGTLPSPSFTGAPAPGSTQVSGLGQVPGGSSTTAPGQLIKESVGASSDTADGQVPGLLPYSLFAERVLYSGASPRIDGADGEEFSQLDVSSTGPSPSDAVVQGHMEQALWVHDVRAYALSAGSAKPTELGPADNVFAEPNGGIYLVTQPSPTSGGVVVDVDPTGNVLTPPTLFPSSTTAVGAVAEGLVLRNDAPTAARAGYRVWSTVTHDTVETFGPVSRLVAISSEAVAWMGSGCDISTCLSLLNTGTDQTVVLSGPWTGVGAFAPNGSYFVGLQKGATPGTDLLVAVGVAGQIGQSIPVAAPPAGVTPTVAFTSDGSWLIYSDGSSLAAVQYEVLSPAAQPGGLAGPAITAGPVHLPLPSSGEPLPL